MISKNQLKFYASLKDRKVRAESGLFLTEGHKIIQEGLKSSCPCQVVLAREGFFGHNEETDRLLSTQHVEIVDEQEFRKLAGTENPQGVLGVFDFRNLLISKLSAEHLIVLFDLADPRNMGTIIRSADWFGFHELVIGETCVDIFNDKVLRSTMGSIFHSRFLQSADLAADLAALKAQYRIFTADLGGTDYRSHKGAGKSAFVFSNEARGPSQAILELTDEVVTIPGEGQAESLNVSCAAAVIMAGIGKI